MDKDEGAAKMPQFFINKRDGLPIAFKISATNKLKPEYRQKIEAAGGTMTAQLGPDIIFLESPALLKPSDIARGNYYKFEFVDACYEVQRLVDKTDYKITLRDLSQPPDGEPVDGWEQSGIESSISKRGRIPFEKVDDFSIIFYILQNEEERLKQVSGNKIWIEMESHGILGQHTWQSAKNRFQNHLAPHFAAFKKQITQEWSKLEAQFRIRQIEGGEVQDENQHPPAFKAKKHGHNEQRKDEGSDKEMEVSRKDAVKTSPSLATAATAAASSTTDRRMHRVPFSEDDEIMLVRYVLEHDPSQKSLNLAEFWQKAEASGSIGNHTWQSAKDRMKKKIIKTGRFTTLKRKMHRLDGGYHQPAESDKKAEVEDEPRDEEMMESEDSNDEEEKEMEVQKAKAVVAPKISAPTAAAAMMMESSSDDDSDVIIPMKIAHALQLVPVGIAPKKQDIRPPSPPPRHCVVPAIFEENEPQDKVDMEEPDVRSKSAATSRLANFVTNTRDLFTAEATQEPGVCESSPKLVSSPPKYNKKASNQPKPLKYIQKLKVDRRGDREVVTVEGINYRAASTSSVESEEDLALKWTIALAEITGLPELQILDLLSDNGGCFATTIAALQSASNVNEQQ